MKKIAARLIGLRYGRLFEEKLPFQLTRGGKVFAEVVVPGTFRWGRCEACGDNTSNIIKFKNKETEKWERLILCDECIGKYL